MEDGLVQEFDFLDRANAFGLNPCCNGRWSRTQMKFRGTACRPMVLILVVMEDGLVQSLKVRSILSVCLNPCCNGRWSRTNK